MENQNYFHLAYDGVECNGFYNEDVHSNIPKNTIKVSEDLWKHLLDLGGFKLKDIIVKPKPMYTLEDVDLFVKLDIDNTDIPKSPMRILQEENAQLMLENATKDIQIKSLEKDMANVLLQIATVGGGA